MEDNGHTYIKPKYGGVCMSKSAKNHKNRVPKLTEAEYTAYLATLQANDEMQKKSVNADMGASFQEKNEQKET
jgi:AICAR transformylase/IMP cyclohydrolase PurH